ncbi:NADH-ubiquinone oxidoreductase chain I [Fulvivirga imtechensis AK7]|uniref:NADH-ubiquinone oxidoreductase chain I n=1 Tax=Fulvivirga imtechensis AK7 TaxID=1237149 RepID=L8JT47_9BACT|nr:4Fe-4S binding protein [Fulvivirga imtechensis]ELR70527.1 NADH-ubiquinone oxidoreductase chain I [Fulvivirga imtechensis AK7]
MKSGYWNNIGQAVSTLWGGLMLTFRHIIDARFSRKPVPVSDDSYFEQDKGLVTVQYPHESFPIPDNGRYRLHNEIDDCIVCDKCAKICPVDCIDIEPIRAVGEIGKTSDGTPKRIYAAKFDINMGLCCFCGLCTTVCPTECLTMTKTYDFSEYDVDDHIYSFATMTPLEILEKKQELEAMEKQKMAEKGAGGEVTKSSAGKSEDKAGEKTIAKPAGVKPKFKPKVKPVAKKPVVKPKPIMRKKDEGKGDDDK